MCEVVLTEILGLVRRPVRQSVLILPRQTSRSGGALECRFIEFGLRVKDRRGFRLCLGRGGSTAASGTSAVVDPTSGSPAEEAEAEAASPPVPVSAWCDGVCDSSAEALCTATIATSRATTETRTKIRFMVTVIPSAKMLQFCCSLKFWCLSTCPPMLTWRYGCFSRQGPIPVRNETLCPFVDLICDWRMYAIC